jgi:plastocyanin
MAAIIARQLKPLVVGVGISLAACGGGGSNMTPSTTAIAKASASSGDAQIGTVGQPLALPLRVVVTDGGAASAGATVAWSTTAPGATVNPASAVTGTDGIAITAWTLGTVSGSQSATATLSGASGSPVTFTATANPIVPEGETVQVLTAGGTRFSPANLTIAVHATVTWNWPVGSIGHNVVPDNGSIPATSGGLVNGPNTYSYTFDVPGTYRYYCLNHGGPAGVGMSGTITVQ